MVPSPLAAHAWASAGAQVWSAHSAAEFELQ
jgi:hypothetical protein